MTLDLNSPVPLYHQLQEILRAQISRKIFVPGSKLPSENELCREYSVTRPTVRQALEGLVREGLLYKHRGKGAFVTAPPSPIGLFNVTGTSDAFAEQKLNVETKVVLIHKVPTCLLAEGNDPAEGWLELHRMRQVNNIPTFFEYTWIAAGLVPDLASIDLNNQSLYHTLAERFGLRVAGGKQRFSAVAAPMDVAQSLKIRVGVPLLRVVRNMDLHRQQPATYTTSPARVDKIMGVLRVDLYAAQGPFVLEQNIPTSTSSTFEFEPVASLTQGVNA